MKRIHLRAPIVALGAAAVASALGACGGAASMGEAKSGSYEASLGNSGDVAMAAFNEAEAQLQRVLGGPSGSAGLAGATAQASASPMAPPPPVKAPQQAEPAPPPPPPVQPGATSPRPSTPTKSGPIRREEQRFEGDAPAGQGSVCSTACSALASMERAAEHLCTLAGAGDARCESARSRVKDAGARVHAACPACAR